MPTRAPTPAQRAAACVRPACAPVMFQSWRHLLFLHWAWDPAAIQATLPPGLFVDTHQDRAYLAVVPFWMDRIRPRFLPPVPGLSWFLELNLRTYVHTADGTPGVWFYSLDCNNHVAVQLARSLFALPYVYAHQHGTRPNAHAPTAHFHSRRSDANASHSSGRKDEGAHALRHAGEQSLRRPEKPARPRLRGRPGPAHGKAQGGQGYRWHFHPCAGGL